MTKPWLTGVPLQLLLNAGLVEVGDEVMVDPEVDMPGVGKPFSCRPETVYMVVSGPLGNSSFCAVEKCVAGYFCAKENIVAWRRP